MYALLLAGTAFVAYYLIANAGTNSSSGDTEFDYVDKKGRKWHFKGNDASGYDMTFPAGLSAPDAPPAGTVGHSPPGHTRAELFQQIEAIP